MKTPVLCTLLVLFFVACGSQRTATTHVHPPPSSDGGSPPTLPPPIDPTGGAGGTPEVPEPDPDPGFEECATQTDAAQLKPLDMVVMLDRSGSMNEDGKWAAVSVALSDFANDPTSAGIGLGVGYFPQAYSSLCLPCSQGCNVCFNGCCALPTGKFCFTDGDCDGGGFCYDFLCHAGGGNASCDAADYASLDVPLGTLPAAALAISASMQATTPDGGTPTGPALSGALSYAASLTDRDRAVVVVLATDAEPTECQPQGALDVAQIAADAHASPSAIPTFVIGVGSSLNNLHAIAAAGGTGQAYMIDVDAKAADHFRAALKTIRLVAVACEYEIPDVKNATILYDKVNVTFRLGQEPPSAVGYVKNASLCNNGGWHYDDEAAPTSINLCPSTCDSLQVLDEVEVEVVYGCATVVQPD
jgi:Mg-chelatase subunit ChlD